MKTLRSIILILVMIAGIVAAWYVGSSQTRRKIEPEIQTLDIEGTIRDIGELATAEYGYTITQVAEKPGKLNIKILGSKVLYSYEGLIKAGIDFTEVEITTNKTQKTIYIKMPKAKILSNELDNDSFKVYDEKYSLFNAMTFEDFNLSQKDMKERAEAEAIKSGLLDRAQENAKSIIETTALNLRESDEYQIVFR